MEFWLVPHFFLSSSIGYIIAKNWNVKKSNPGVANRQCWNTKNLQVMAEGDKTSTEIVTKFHSSRETNQSNRETNQSSRDSNQSSRETTPTSGSRNLVTKQIGMPERVKAALLYLKYLVLFPIPAGKSIISILQTSVNDQFKCAQIRIMLLFLSKSMFKR